MIEIEQALRSIEASAKPLGAIMVPLVDTVGRMATTDIRSTIDSPPYDKSMMDGFALNDHDAEVAINESGTLRLPVVERILAGDIPANPLEPGMAAQIMTGAPIPQGSNTVVMIERTQEFRTGQRSFVEIAAKDVRPNQNILKRGAVFRSGDLIIPAGHFIRAHDIGVLAEVGVDHCHVPRQPNLAVIATGNELVPHETEPRFGQIRNSNGPMLAALAQNAGCAVENLGIAIDDRKELESRIQWGLASDILVLSGGVSAGSADLIPDILKSLDVTKIFHKVAIKPGKPLWFGCYQRKEHRCLVFGLPGNPASSLVGFQVFVKLAILRLQGRRDIYPVFERAVLDREFDLRGDRTTFWPAWFGIENQQAVCTPIDWRGSADVLAITQANALARFQPSGTPYAKGSQVDVLRLNE